MDESSTTQKEPQDFGPVKAQYHKTEAHQRYRLKDGSIVPGSTTVLGCLAKPALIHWAWQCGMDNVDYKKIKDEAADIGSLAHWMAECHIRGLDPDTSPFSKDQIDQAENSFLKFLEWYEGEKFTAVALQGQNGEVVRGEVQLVSERYRYGGTVDLPAMDRDDRETLVDFKTSKAIYPEYWMQLASYDNLLRENKVFFPKRWIIVRMGKKEAGDFEVIEKRDIRKYWTAFKSVRETYSALKSIN